MKLCNLLYLFLFLSASGHLAAMQFQQPDFSDYNILWTEQSENSSESMPLGGGDIGCNVWVEKGELLLYVQRSGSLAETNEYLKLGRIRVKLSPNPFAKEGKDYEFRQELKLHDGYIEIHGKNKDSGTPLEVKIAIWVEVNEPIVHLEVEANEKIRVDAAYENWRMNPESMTNDGRRHSTFNLDAYPGEITLSKDHVQQMDSGIIFYHRNPDDKLVPELMIEQQGLENYRDQITDDLKDRTFGGMLLGNGFIPSKTTSGEYAGKPFKAWHIASKKKRKKHHLKMVTHIGQYMDLDGWKNGLEKTIAKSNTVESQQMHDSTKNWWHKFWSRSYIFINSATADINDKAWTIARNYQLFRYQLGCNVYGEYPTKFNGGNFTFDSGHVKTERDYGPDFRQWGGGVFTAQNQRLVHWPMLRSGDYDAILPHFELYRKALPGAKARVKEHFKHNGAVYSEYNSVPGLAIGNGYGWLEGRRKRGEEIPFGDERATGARAYDDVVEKGVMANGSIAYHWESQIEQSYMILEYHRYTGADISKYMPFIEQSLIFFDEHYRLRQKMRNGKELNENGKLVIFPSTSCESYRGAKNPVDVLSGLKAALKSLLLLDETYITPEKKNYYAEFLGRIPDYPFDEVEGRPIIKPAETWLRESNQEMPQFYPLFPFNQFKLGDEEISSFKNTYALAPEFRKGNVISWHQDGIFLARMGMTEAAAEYNTRKLMSSERRFPTFWGPGYDWVPDHNWGGSGMIGLQEMLMQTVDDQIVLFPAWPTEWDVKFKLHAPKNTIVEGEFKDGKLLDLKVIPENRRKHVHILNQK
ncbi:hypothetical protein SAMN05421766_11314 [Zobellia uliginosa]|uniref:DUF5703 domain-containing protein n=1 Tax=Zobellia uliginosa TaxID=143224 RepID=A0ABY1L5Q4_9FLAO|nr:DUF5703 domain-containing protein [Zobellia uliginosa]SIT13857.1 hypothetical protein SAMN05421766_11314 [Zobellia uliginosa]